MSLQSLLAEGGPVVTAEVNPPRHAGVGDLRAAACTLGGAVDAVNLTDGTRGIVRMSATAAALVVRDGGVEPIVQMTCRDRNRIALQSELLGLSALGLPNVLCLSGDDPSNGDHPDATPVFDLDGTGLLAAASAMTREGRLLSGRVMAHKPALFLGAAGDPGRDVGALEAKVAAGAGFVQTQPVFDLASFELWMAQARATGLQQRAAILPGVFIVDSAGRAEFLATKVPGMAVPGEVARRLRAAADERSEGVVLAAETVRALLATPGTAGVHLMGIEATEAMVEVVEKAGVR